MKNLPDAAPVCYRSGKQPAKTAVITGPAIIKDRPPSRPRQDAARVARRLDEQRVTSRSLPWPLFA